MSDPADRLIDALRAPDLPDYDDGTAADALAPWHVQDLAGAAWAARKLARVRTKRDQIAAHARAEREAIDAWETNERRHLDHDEAFFCDRLRQWHEQILTDDPKAKTIHLPDGTTLTTTAGRLTVEIDDQTALIEWAETHAADDILRYDDPKPDKVAIATTYGTKAAQETEPGDYPAVDPNTGEIIPGLRIIRKPRSYTIDTPKKGQP